MDFKDAIRTMGGALTQIDKNNSTFGNWAIGQSNDSQ
jgi:hypothetical protein